MARNLAAAGLEVVGVEPSAQRRADAAELTTVGALGHAPSTTVLVMVADAEQLTAVVDDALAAGPTRATCILHLGVDAVRTQAERLQTIGARVVDLLVTGGVAGATAGTLMLFVGGADEDIAAAQPGAAPLYFEVVGGRVGDGQMMKMVNQHLCSIHRRRPPRRCPSPAGWGSISSLALELLGRGAAASWMLTDRGPRMLTPPQTVNSSVDIFAKDSQLVQATAEYAAAPVPVLAAAREHFVGAQQRGAGRDDDSQVIAYLDSLS